MGKIHQVPEVATISADLADILRSSITNDEFVPLEQELRLLDRYVEIQRIRFSGTFQLCTQVDDGLRLHYGPDNGLRFVPTGGRGTCVRITLPITRREVPSC